jgi:hypothetical protein
LVFMHLSNVAKEPRGQCDRSAACKCSTLK